VAKEVLTQASVLVNSVDLSNNASSVEMEDTAEEVEVTGFSVNDYREFIPGLKDGNITVTFFNDHAAGSVADTLQPLYTSGGTFPLRIKPDISGTVAYTMTARLYSNPLLAGGVGEANTVDVTFRNAGTAGITRGSLAAGTP
jgi:hypothetical protein